MLYKNVKYYICVDYSIIFEGMQEENAILYIIPGQIRYKFSLFIEFSIQFIHIIGY